MARRIDGVMEVAKSRAQRRGRGQRPLDDSIKNGKGRGSGTTAQQAQHVAKLIRENNIQIVDFKFNDLPGLWQHFSIPAGQLTQYNDHSKSMWVDGIGFDGSSIRGFQKIQESDMILIPDPSTAVVDPVCTVPTVSIICDIYDPITHQPYSRDPRYIAKKAERYLKKTGIATTSYWGPEAEFYIFDDVRFEQKENTASYFVDSVEGQWNTGRIENPNLGYKPRYKEGYFPVPPHDKFQDLRSEIILTMIKTGIPVEVQHHEVGTGGQAEIDMRYDTLTKMADNLLMYKYIVKNVCNKYNKVATFMPKPIFNDNGSGMHVHQSLWNQNKNLFFDPKGYGLLSQQARWYIGGIIKHAHAIMAFAAPTTNSYRRLVPGFEAPTNLIYSLRNRSAAIRIPVYTENPKSKRIEFRAPDPSCNPYIAFSAMLMAGLDGIRNRIEPPQPIEKDLYEISAQEQRKIKQVPRSLEEALNALEKDQDFLLEGGVFTQDVIDVWLEFKRTRELDELRLRPTPYEFYMYFDI
jgi:glutamine synthetase